MRNVTLAIQEDFGEYIVARQKAENLHKPFQCYKDDYVLNELLCRKHHAEEIRVVINTYASDLALFDIK
jgi:hypothetical protein